MTAADLFADSFGRIREVVHHVVEGLTPDQLSFRVDDANSIAWLVWHLTRVQDDHVADAFGTEQVWLRDGWNERFALPFAPHAHGYGHSSEDVAQVKPDKDLLVGYHDAVHAQTITQVEKLTDADLPRVVDR